MDKENIENQSPVGLSTVSGPNVGHTVEIPSSARSEVGLGQENEDRSGLGAAEEAGAKSKLKITIRSWSGVAVWKWLANDDTCGICRVAFDGCCPDCKFAGDDCPLVIFPFLLYRVKIKTILFRSGESVPIVSTSIASRSGWEPNRPSTNALCADKTGNTKNKIHQRFAIIVKINF